MEDLLSKAHYCFKIHTLLMKSSVYLSLPKCYKKTLIPPSIFPKFPPL